MIPNRTNIAYLPAGKTRSRKLAAVIALGLLISPMTMLRGDEPEQGVPVPAQPDTQKQTIPDFLAKIVSFKGYLESENFFTYPGNRGSRYDIYKVELHPKLEVTIGDPETVYARTVMHGYLYPDRASGDNCYRNRLEVAELYGGVLMPNAELRVGKQIVKWGTAQVINPTSYFAPFDFRESLLKDPDELYLGSILALLKISIKDVSLTGIVSPIHTRTRMPGFGSPWHLSFPSRTVPDTASPYAFTWFPMFYANSGAAPTQKMQNLGYGGRLAVSLPGIDLSVSAYHGPDRDVFLYPMFFRNPGAMPGAAVAVTSVYKNVTVVGADCSFTVKQITLYAEGTYSINKTAITRQREGTGYINRIEHQGFLYYAGGFTWLITDDTRLGVEYTQGIFVMKNGRYRPAFFSDVLSAGVEQKFIESSFILGVDGMYNTAQRDWLIMPRVGWDFQNGVLVEVRGAVFTGRPFTLFGSFKDRDVLSLRLKFSF